MSYARPSGDSHVYAWGGQGEDGEPLYFCDSCLLTANHGYFRCESLKELREHLKAHRRAGHLVPDEAFAQIAREMQQEKQRHERAKK